MSKYTKYTSESAVMGTITTITDLDTGNSFQDVEGSQNPHYQQYLAWLAEGNEPEVIDFNPDIEE